MKTFEQYINEARQNYIFGGTDDRNTDVGTTFDELCEGDSVYVAYVIASTHRLESAKKYTIRETRLESDKFVMSYGKRLYKDMTISDAKNRVIVYTYIGMDRHYIFATDEQEFLNKIMELTGVKKVEIKDETTLQEARQNYIFGGTDNRVPKIGSTPIDELIEGDKIYYWSRTYGNEAYECKVTKEEETDDKFIIDVIMDGGENSLYVNKKFYERGSDVCVCKHEHVFAVFATDKETFLDTCNENSIKIDNII